MKTRRMSIFATALTTSLLFATSASALGPWTTGSAQGSDDPDGVAARESMTATAAGIGFLASFGRGAGQGPFTPPPLPPSSMCLPNSGHNVLFYGWDTPAGYVDQQCLFGSLGSNPLTAVSWGYNDVSVFYSRRGSSSVDNLIVRNFDGSVWSAPIDLGGGMRPHARVVAVSWGVGHKAVFHRGPNNNLYYFSFNGTSWSSEQNLGGYMTGPPVVVTPAVGQYVACANRDIHGHDFDCRIRKDGSWGEWHKIHTGPVASYQLVSALPGTATAIVSKQTTAGVYHFYTSTWDGVAWGPWVNTGINSTGTKLLDATSWGGGRIDFVYRYDVQYTYTEPGSSSAVYDAPARLYHGWFDGTNWQYEILPPTDLALGARIVSWGPGRLDIFYDRAYLVPANGIWAQHYALGGAGHIYATD